jgi:hypothetical protein
MHPKGGDALMISWLAAAAFGAMDFVAALFFAEGVDWK